MGVIPVGGMMGEEHDARQRDHKSKTVGAGKAPLSLGSGNSD